MVWRFLSKSFPGTIFLEPLKIYRIIFPAIFTEIFHGRYINYNLRINSEFALSNVNSGSMEVKVFRN